MTWWRHASNGCEQHVPGSVGRARSLGGEAATGGDVAVGGRPGEGTTGRGLSGGDAPPVPPTFYPTGTNGRTDRHATAHPRARTHARTPLYTAPRPGQRPAALRADTYPGLTSTPPAALTPVQAGRLWRSLSVTQRLLHTALAVRAGGSRHRGRAATAGSRRGDSRRPAYAGTGKSPTPALGVSQNAPPAARM